jgi:hypothetical protein
MMRSIFASGLLALAALGVLLLAAAFLIEALAPYAPTLSLAGGIIFGSAAIIRFVVSRARYRRAMAEEAAYDDSQK